VTGPGGRIIQHRRHAGISPAPRSARGGLLSQTDEGRWLRSIISAGCRFFSLFGRTPFALNVVISAPRPRSGGRQKRGVLDAMISGCYRTATQGFGLCKVAVIQERISHTLRRRSTRAFCIGVLTARAVVGNPGQAGAACMRSLAR
jgi:hypothetical protein